MCDEGLGQQPNHPEIHQHRPSVLVDAKVALVHVRLRENEAITTYIDRKHLLSRVGREKRAFLAQITGR